MAEVAEHVAASPHRRFGPLPKPPGEIRSIRSYFDNVVVGDVQRLEGNWVNLACEWEGSRLLYPIRASDKEEAGRLGRFLAANKGRSFPEIAILDLSSY